MAKVAILLADGCEPVEALAPADVLSRGGQDVTLVSINETNAVACAHGVNVVADDTLAAHDFSDCDLVVLPGGMPGTPHLRANARVCELTREFLADRKLGAICAAPSILAELGLLEGRTATCFPGCEGAFPAGVRPEALGVYTDGNLVTASGPAYAIDFGLALLRELAGDEVAQRVADGMLESDRAK